MKKTLTFKGLALGLLISSMVPAVAFAGDSTFQSENLRFFVGGAVTTGAGTLTRHNNSVHLRVAATGLDATAVYSAWFVIFNKPEKCADNTPGGCALDDIGVPAVKAAVINAGGFLSGADGSGYFSGTLEPGKAPSGMCCFGKLMSGMKSEIHVLLLTHGTPVPGTVNAHMSTPDGGTDQFFLIFTATK